MTILLTNDDGIHAPGLAHLTAALAGLDELVVVAPERNASGVGHSITLDHEIIVRHLDAGLHGERRVSVGGTPADAVKFAMKHELGALPRLVVSGINAGPNVGVNVLYSGTVGAALEALIQGVSSVAVSSADFDIPHYETAGHFARQVVIEALTLEAERRADRGALPFCLNLNVPSRPLAEVRGLRVTQHGRSGFAEFFEASPAADTYVIDGVMRVHDPDETYCAAAVMAGYASLTPLQIDLTDRARLAFMRDRFGEMTGAGERRTRP